MSSAWVCEGMRGDARGYEGMRCETRRGDVMRGGAL